MLVEVKRNGAWRCFCNPRQQEWVQSLPEIPELLDSLTMLPITLKNNHRSVVLRGELSGKSLVAKRPLNKNKKLWARILSVIEPAEALQTLSTLERFHEQGIQSVQPLFVLEKRAFGAVTDSWLCYEFRQGEPVGEAGALGVIQMLQKIHLAGFRHNDPNLVNFLIDESGEMFVIDSRGRKRSGNFSDANDFFLFKKINKTLTNFKMSDIKHLDRTTLGYRLALVYNKMKEIRSAIKNKIKKNRPKNTKS